MTFEEFFHSRRIQEGYTLRSFCKSFEYDTAYISRLENGKLKPPKNAAKLRVLARALGLSESTSEWITFHDLAAAARKELPKDIKSSAPKLFTFLPAYLRTKDNRKISKEKVEELLDFLTKGAPDVDEF